jgi:hypothetical protein
VNVAIVVIIISVKEWKNNFYERHLEYSAIIVIERVHVVFVLIDIRMKEKKRVNRQDHLEYFANME